MLPILSAVHNSGFESASDESLWLELSLEGVSHTFELNADETRAIAVGSQMRSDLRIDHPDVAPVHFHIEREADAVWIVPAYGAGDVRVNAAHISGPKLIDGHAVIEFSNVRLDARVIDLGSAVMRSCSPDDLLTKPIEASFISVEIARAQTTHPIVPMAADRAPSACALAAIEPHRIVALSSDNTDEETPARLPAAQYTTQGSAIAALAEGQTSICPDDTIKMAPFWMAATETKRQEPVEAPPARDERSELGRVPVDTGLQVLRSAAEVAFPPFGQGGGTTNLDPVNPVSGSGQDWTRDSSRVWSDEAGEQNWLARLGVLATRRPLLVWLVGTATVFILSAAFALASKH